MTTDPKPLTRKELLAMAREYKDDHAIQGLARTVAALLPADGALSATDEDARIRRELARMAAALRTAEERAEQVERDLAQEIARAEAAEKRVAELKKCHHIVERYSQKVYVAGIREGLGRAAEAARQWSNAFGHDFAREITEMKEQVK